MLIILKYLRCIEDTESKNSIQKIHILKKSKKYVSVHVMVVLMLQRKQFIESSKG